MSTSISTLFSQATPAPEAEFTATTLTGLFEAAQVCHTRWHFTISQSGSNYILHTTSPSPLWSDTGMTDLTFSAPGTTQTESLTVQLCGLGYSQADGVVNVSATCLYMSKSACLIEVQLSLNQSAITKNTGGGGFSSSVAPTLNVTTLYSSYGTYSSTVTPIYSETTIVNIFKKTVDDIISGFEDTWNKEEAVMTGVGSQNTAATTLETNTVAAATTMVSNAKSALAAYVQTLNYTKTAATASLSTVYGQLNSALSKFTSDIQGIQLTSNVSVSSSTYTAQTYNQGAVSSYLSSIGLGD